MSMDIGLSENVIEEFLCFIGVSQTHRSDTGHHISPSSTVEHTEVNHYTKRVL